MAVPLWGITQRRGWLALIVAAAAAVGFAIGVSPQIAKATHWHATGHCSGAWHSFVHGSSSTDRSYRAQVEQGQCPPTQHDCALHNSRTSVSLDYDSVYYGTCDAFVHSTDYSYAECHGYGIGVYSTVFNAHTHLAHNWCG